MPSAIFLVLFAACTTMAAAQDDRRRDYDYFEPLRPYPPPVDLPMLPRYDVDIPAEQDGKMFGHVAATKYETIIVKETVRPVCLYVDGNVPSCDHFHNYNNHPMAGNGRRPSIIDYESYFIEPDRPKEKIEITEIPFRGAFLLTGATDEPDDDQVTGTGDETPPLQAARSATEAVPARDADQRQFLQNALNTAVSAGLNGIVSNVGGGLLSGALANVAGAVGVPVANVAVAAGGGGRRQVTVFVTRVDKVVDVRVTATLVPKNCMPSGGRVDALRPCAADPYAALYPYQQQLLYQPPQQPYLQQQQQQQQPQPQQHQKPTSAAADIVSHVDGLVKDLVSSQTTSSYRHRLRTLFDCQHNGQ